MTAQAADKSAFHMPLCEMQRRVYVLLIEIVTWSLVPLLDACLELSRPGKRQVAQIAQEADAPLNPHRETGAACYS